MVPLPSDFLFCNKLPIFICVIFYLRFTSKPREKRKSSVDTLSPIGATCSSGALPAGRGRGAAGLALGLQSLHNTRISAFFLCLFLFLEPFLRKL